MSSTKNDILGAAVLLYIFYIIVGAVGIRYSILSGFQKDIGIISPVLIMFTITWLSIPFGVSKNK